MSIFSACFGLLTSVQLAAKTSSGQIWISGWILPHFDVRTLSVAWKLKKLSNIFWQKIFFLLHPLSKGVAPLWNGPPHENNFYAFYFNCLILHYRYIATGVFSRCMRNATIKCCNDPVVYTRVATLQEWIRKHAPGVRDSAGCPKQIEVPDCQCDHDSMCTGQRQKCTNCMCLPEGNLFSFIQTSC